MIEIVIQFEGRTKLLKLQTGEESELRSQFGKLCSRDPVLLQRTMTHYPTFKVFNERCGLDVEIEPWEKITEGVVMKVFFASYAVVRAMGVISALSNGILYLSYIILSVNVEFV